MWFCTAWFCFTTGCADKVGLPGCVHYRKWFWLLNRISYLILEVTAIWNVTAISLPSKETRANVHTGAQPPWLDMSESRHSSSADTGLWRKKAACAPSKYGKSRKLNPKRVGAAWAEKRTLELEMEKRGEFVSKVSDADWLPNFGRVWQTGTRKESRKEFEIEKRKLLEDKIQPELPVDIQPYISKRMRQSSKEDVTVNGSYTEGSAFNSHFHENCEAL